MNLTKTLILVFATGCALLTTAEVVEVNDMEPYGSAGVNDFWDCTAHTCKVERVASASQIGFELETRSFVDEVSSEFDFTTDPPGIIIIVR